MTVKNWSAGEKLKATDLNDTVAVKADKTHTHTTAAITDMSAAGKAIATAPSVGAVKATLGLTKADVGLGNVDNTPDASKPVSTLQANAIADRAPLVHVHDGADIATGTINAARYSQSMSAALDALLGASTGDLMFRSASGWARLPKGATGQVLQQGASGPLWATLSGVATTPDTAPANTAVPTITGSTIAGQTLTTSTGTWTGSPTPTYAFQWYRSQSGAFNVSNLVLIANATGSTYVSTNADLGFVLYVKVTGSNTVSSASAYSVATSVVTSPTLPVPVNTTAPLISGTLQVGYTLSTTNGTWTNSPTSYTFQWNRDGVAISGATASTYLLVSGDATHALSVTVTAINASGQAQAVSAATATIAAAPSAAPILLAAPVISGSTTSGGTLTTTQASWSESLSTPTNTAVPVISGAAIVGQTLSATSGSWTNAPTSYTYQWKRAGTDISGATSATYLLVTADIGSAITVAVTATNGAGTSTAAISTATATVVANTSSGTTWNPSDNTTTLSNSNKTASNAGGYGTRAANRATAKCYIEFLWATSNVSGTLGLSDPLVNTNPEEPRPGSDATSFGWLGGNNGAVQDNSGSTLGSVPFPISGQTARMCIDPTARLVWICTNTDNWNNSSTANPATGVGGFSIPGTFRLFPTIRFDGTGADVVTIKSTSAEWAYSAPSGFTAIA